MSFTQDNPSAPVNAPATSAHHLPAKPLSAAMREALLASGFQSNPGPQTTYTKRLLAMHMPYFVEHIIDEKVVCKEDLVVVVVSEAGYVSLSILDGEYTEEPVAAESPEGLGLLCDAGYVESI
jgi:hypothetical protein